LILWASSLARESGTSSRTLGDTMEKRWVREEVKRCCLFSPNELDEFGGLFFRWEGFVSGKREEDVEKYVGFRKGSLH